MEVKILSLILPILLHFSPKKNIFWPLTWKVNVLVALKGTKCFALLNTLVFPGNTVAKWSMRWTLGRDLAGSLGCVLEAKHFILKVPLST